MPEQLSETKKSKKIRHIEQISEDHCGPAVLEMLLDNLGLEFDQKQITKAAGAEKTIIGRGTRVDQLAMAVSNLAPNLKFWFKDNASLNDLKSVIHTHGYPVGVEWQGLFEESLEDEEGYEGEYGHYSVVSHIDEEKGQMIIVDPYKEFVKQDRIVPIKLFLQRWWDWNEYLNPETKESTYKKDVKLFFIVALGNETFPQDLGMQQCLS